MAVWEPKKQWQITQVSWTDWTAQDVYYWLENSFQYASNINCDDEMHGIKLANKVNNTSSYSACQLVSLWNNGVIALPATVDSAPKIFSWTWSSWSWWSTAWPAVRQSWANTCPWVVFQDRFWYGITNNSRSWMVSIALSWWSEKLFRPCDHSDSTDESISTEDANPLETFIWSVTAILNYNNTRLVVACWQDIWVYYPELDGWQTFGGSVYGKTGWKKVLSYEAWVTIVALTCTFEYLKVWAVDEWRSTKVYYYQWNNNLRDTFVYNVIDLTGEKVLRVYSLNSTDYFITSIDGTDGYVNLNKMVGNTPVQLFHQRAWLDPLDINYKAPYFVWPVGINAAYKSGRIYIADSYGVFQFKYNPQGFDKWYMKWSFWWQKTVYWVCENKGFLYVSTNDGCYVMRIYDTWVDGYQSKGVLISREYEGKEWGTFTKMLDEVRLNYELNPSGNATNPWIINIYVSPNNLWTNTSSFTEANKWYRVMTIDSSSRWTRTERTNLLNSLWNSDTSSFKFDWQTITYAIVMTQSSSTHATPIVRQIDLKYHVKDKINNVYNIN